MQSVKYNDEDFTTTNDYDHFKGLEYKGQPFSGTLIFGDTHTEFQNGEAHGKSISYNDDGKILLLEIYEKGEELSSKGWYSNGVLKHDDSTYWDADGLLAFENNCWFYKSGAVKLKNLENGSNVFDSRGNIAIEVIYNRAGKNTVIYYDNIMEEAYEELLINLYPHLDSLFYNLEHEFWMWHSKIYTINRERALKILKVLLSNPDSSIKKTAKFRLENMHTWKINEDFLNSSFYIKLI